LRMKFLYLDAYPRGGVIVNVDNISIIRESDDNTVTIYFIDETFVQVPHTLGQISELVGATTEE
jgi:hypothetical protein